MRSHNVTIILHYIRLHLTTKFLVTDFKKLANISTGSSTKCNKTAGLTNQEETVMKLCPGLSMSTCHGATLLHCTTFIHFALGFGDLVAQRCQGEALVAAGGGSGCS